MSRKRSAGLGSSVEVGNMGNPEDQGMVFALSMILDHLSDLAQQPLGSLYVWTWKMASERSIFSEDRVPAWTMFWVTATIVLAQFTRRSSHKGGNESNFLYVRVNMLCEHKKCRVESGILCIALPQLSWGPQQTSVGCWREIWKGFMLW